MSTPTNDEIRSIVVTGLGFEDESTGERKQDLTVGEFVDEMLAKDLSQIGTAFLAVITAIRANRWDIARGVISEIYEHINEVTGPSIAAIHMTVQEYLDRREQMGEVVIPDFLPTDFRAPSQRHA